MGVLYSFLGRDQVRTLESSALASAIPFVRVAFEHRGTGKQRVRNRGATVARFV